MKVTYILLEDLTCVALVVVLAATLFAASFLALVVKETTSILISHAREAATSANFHIHLGHALNPLRPHRHTANS